MVAHTAISILGGSPCPSASQSSQSPFVPAFSHSCPLTAGPSVAVCSRSRFQLCAAATLQPAAGCKCELESAWAHSEGGEWLSIRIRKRRQGINCQDAEGRVRNDDPASRTACAPQRSPQLICGESAIRFISWLKPLENSTPASSANSPHPPNETIK